MYDEWDEDDDDMSVASYYDDDSGSEVPVVEKNHEDNKIKIHAPVIEPGSQFVLDLKMHAEKGDVDAVSRFLDCLPATNSVAADGDGLDEGEKRATVDVNVGDGWSALMHAACCGRRAVVELLLARGADPNLQADDDSTPLSVVCSSNKAEEEDAAEVVKVLVKAGARLVEEEPLNSFARPHPPRSLLHLAARLNLPIVVKALVDSGLNVNSRDGYDWTPLMVAAEEGALAAANSLLSLGADPLLRIRPRRSCDPNTIDATAATLASLAGNTQLSDALRVLGGQTAGDDRLYRVLRRLREEEEAEERAEDAEEEEDDLIRKKSDELATFLHGVGLYEMLPKMRAQKISLSMLMKTSDAQLKELGVEKIGDRTRILNTVHEMHKVAWTEDKPSHLEFGKPLKLRDVVAVVGNTSRHMEFLDASVSYVNNQVHEYRQFYVTAVETRPNAPAMMASIDGICEEGIESCRQLFNNLCLLRRQTAAVRGEAEVSAIPDLIPPTIPLQKQTSRSRLVLFPVLGAVLIFLAIRSRRAILSRVSGLISRLRTT